MTGCTEGIYVWTKNPTVTGTSMIRPTPTTSSYKGKTTLTSEDGKLFASKGYYDNVSINGTEDHQGPPVPPSKPSDG